MKKIIYLITFISILLTASMAVYAADDSADIRQLLENGGTVVLTQDYTLNGKVSISKDTLLDLCSLKMCDNY